MVKTVNDYNLELAELNKTKLALEKKCQDLKSELANLDEFNKNILEQIYAMTHLDKTVTQEMGLRVADLVLPTDTDEITKFATKQQKSWQETMNKKMRAIQRELRIEHNRHDQLSKCLKQLQSIHPSDESGIIKILRDLDPSITWSNLKSAGFARLDCIQRAEQLLHETNQKLSKLAESEQRVKVSDTEIKSFISTLGNNIREQVLFRADIQKIENDELPKVNQFILDAQNGLNLALTQQVTTKAGMRPRQATIESSASIVKRNDLLKKFQGHMQTFDANLKIGKDDRAMLVKLKDAVERYKNSSNESVFLKFVDDNLNTPSIPLRALLNKIKLECLVYGREIRHLSKSRVSVLDNYGDKKIKEVILNLYEQMTKMNNYGQKLKDPESNIVMTLAGELSEDMNDFLATNFVSRANNTGQLKLNFLEFRERFITRLHTQDDVMSQQATKWKHILVNMLAGLLTLGVALGVKLSYSKYKEGRASFFMSQTGKQQHLKQVEESFHDVEKKLIDGGNPTPK